MQITGTPHCALGTNEGVEREREDRPTVGLDRQQMRDGFGGYRFGFTQSVLVPPQALGG